MKYSLTKRWGVILLTFALCAVSLFTVQSSVEAASNPNGTISEWFEDEEPPSKVSDTPPAAEDEPIPAAVGLSFGDFVKMIFALLFVVALLYGLLKFVN